MGDLTRNRLVLLRKVSQTMDESQTRKTRIDPMLQSAGWKVIAYDPSTPLSACHHCAIEEYPTENGPADYALCLDGRITGIVEAKKE